MNTEHRASHFSATDQPELALVEMRRELEERVGRLAEAVPPSAKTASRARRDSSTYDLLIELLERGILTKNLVDSVNGVIKIGQSSRSRDTSQPVRCG